MTSADLRRIVGAMTEREPTCNGGTNGGTATGCSVGHAYACPAYGHRRARQDAQRTLANHADALVTLMEAVERMQTPLIPSIDVQAVLLALRAVHAVRSEP